MMEVFISYHTIMGDTCSADTGWDVKTKIYAKVGIPGRQSHRRFLSKTLLFFHFGVKNESLN